jgi:hypothetical protein
MKDEIVESLRLKLFFTYYLKKSATKKDLLLFIIRSLNNDKSNQQIKFRATHIRVSKKRK